MKIHADKLSKAMEAKGLDAAALAQAIAGESFKPADAARAITNWCAGRDHPRCKAPMIRAMSQALAVRPVDICKFTSQVRGHRGSPRKAKLLIDLIRGKSVEQARNMLTFSDKRAAANIRRALNAALTEAEQAEASYDRLYVSECTVDGGMIMKRFQPKDRGRAHPIHKYFSHISVSVEERAEEPAAKKGKKSK